MTCLPEELKKMLDREGWNYEVEDRSKHQILKVEGERIAVLSRGPKTKRRTLLNTMARIRRMMRSKSNE